MPHDFIPSREADLLHWSKNLRDRLNTPPGPGAYGISSALSAQYTVLHGAYANAHTVAINPATNSKANVMAKNVAKAALKDFARALARIVRATPGITNPQKVELGLTVSDAGGEGSRGRGGTPVSRPSDKPVVTIVSSFDRYVRIRLRSMNEPMRKGKPPGIAGAAVLSYVGSAQEIEPPARMSDWTFHGNATRRFFDLGFDAHVPAGAKVWITAIWYSTRGKFGPPSTAASTRVGDGMAGTAMAA